MALSDKSVNRLQNASTLILLISIVQAVIHCWKTRHVAQPNLVYSYMLIIVSAGMMLPYNWDRHLMRYRILAQIVLFAAALVLLLPAVFKGEPEHPPL
jgi:intracellular septation protein A